MEREFVPLNGYGSWVDSNVKLCTVANGNGKWPICKIRWNSKPFLCLVKLLDCIWYICNDINILGLYRFSLLVQFENGRTRRRMSTATKPLNGRHCEERVQCNYGKRLFEAAPNIYRIYSHKQIVLTLTHPQVTVMSAFFLWRTAFFLIPVFNNLQAILLLSVHYVIVFKQWLHWKSDIIRCIFSTWRFLKRTVLHV